MNPLVPTTQGGHAAGIGASKEESMLIAHEILEGYEFGLYIDGETVARSIDALVGSNQRDLLWRSLSGWIRQRIDETLDRFSAGDEVVTFGHVDPKIAHDELAEMKRWRKLAKGQ
ncbi:hypothetical protein [Dyella telluris]|uniref:Uncharacterized protein n=1 Tax=Dyella telluris TaxID=2763498 RepID=A0A7G8Q651_9GAMM|nr:hypothetical protein [Dyella telluris]QNK02259.1 hypothetical protein H8F01_03610 [Dyella telluris]